MHSKKIISKKKITLLIFAILILASTISTLFIAQVNDVPLSNSYLEDTLEKNESLFQVPATSIHVFDLNSITHSKTIGFQTIDKKIPVTENSYFHVGSTAKSVLALISGKCVQNNLIDFQTNFFDLYPELKSSSNPSYYNLTLADLLNCRGGFSPYTQGDSSVEVSNPYANTYEFAKELLSVPPQKPIQKNGEFPHEYSNSCYALAALMLEKSTNKTYEDLIAQFFKDNGSFDYQFGFAYNNDATAPYGHLLQSNTVVGPDSNYELARFLRPSGDLSMTPVSYTSYARLHLNGLCGKSNYLPKEVFEYLDYGDSSIQTNQEYFAYGSYCGTLFGKRYVNIDGTIGTFFARTILFPDDQWGFTIVMNSGNELSVNYLCARIIKAHYRLKWMFFV